MSKKAAKKKSNAKKINVICRMLSPDTIAESYHGLDCRLMIIDFKKDRNMGKAFLHELMHFRYPNDSEYEITRKTEKTWNGMSQTDCIELHIHLLDAIRSINPHG